MAKELVVFECLDPRDVFIHDGDVFIKTEDIIMKNGREQNAINLETGFLCYFEHNDVVTYVDMESIEKLITKIII